MEAAGGRDCLEQRGLGPRHPHLSAPFQPGIKRGPALGVEMRGDLVEQQDRRRSAALCDQRGMGKDDPDQQRLLLAGRAERGGLALGEMDDVEILAVRADGRPPGGGIAPARGPERGGQIARRPSR